MTQCYCWISYVENSVRMGRIVIEDSNVAKSVTTEGTVVNIEKLYSIADTAELLGGVSPNTVKFWLSTGRMQRTKVGSRTMIAESEIQRIKNVGGVSYAPVPRKRKELTAVG